MIRLITEHNRLNGFLVVAVEFLLVAGAAAFIGVGFGLHGQWLGAALAAGTTLNCLVVVAFALAQRRRGERSHSLRDLGDSGYRRQVAQEHPTLSTDTVALAAAALCPYALLVGVCVDLVRQAPR